MAETEGFEPSRQYSRPTPLAGAPLQPLEYVSIIETVHCIRSYNDTVFFKSCQLISLLIFAYNGFPHMKHLREPFFILAPQWGQVIYSLCSPDRLFVGWVGILFVIGGISD